MSGALAVVLLGAGASSRMGRPKLLLPWAGTTVVGRLVAQWRGLGAARVAVVVRPGDEGLGRELGRIGVPPGDRIPNPRAEEGMFSSVLCAARWEGWGAETASLAFVLGDQPHLREETLRGLLAFHEERPGEICQPAFEGRPKHPVIVPRAAWRRLAGTGAATFREFLEVEPRALFPSGDAGLSLDLDTPEDYTRLAGLASLPPSSPA